MDQKLVDILVCPLCKSGLFHQPTELICKPCKLAYPIRDDIPIMLIDEARQLSAEEN